MTRAAARRERTVLGLSWVRSAIASSEALPRRIRSSSASARRVAASCWLALAGIRITFEFSIASSIERRIHHTAYVENLTARR